MSNIEEVPFESNRDGEKKEKRIFKIDVSNLDPDDVEAYIKKIAEKFKKTSKDNEFKYNILTYDQDIYIPPRDNNPPPDISKLKSS